MLVCAFKVVDCALIFPKMPIAALWERAPVKAKAGMADLLWVKAAAA